MSQPTKLPQDLIKNYFLNINVVSFIETIQSVPGRNLNIVGDIYVRCSGARAGPLSTDEQHAMLQRAIVLTAGSGNLSHQANRVHCVT
jgi:hypothetical protein